MIQTDVVSDSVVAPVKEIAMLKDMSFDDLIHTLISEAVHFAISVAIAVLVFYVGKWIIRRIYNLVDSILRRRSVEASLTTFVLSFVNIVLYFILIVTVVGILGVETSSFLALFASAGVAIGLALSGTLQNFAGGVLILLLKPFKVGDVIEAQGYAGTVKKIEIFNTVITTPDNKTIIIPNGGLSTGSINNSTTQLYRRVEWKIGISYGDKVAPAREAILAMLKADDAIRWSGNRPADAGADPEVVVSSLDDCAVTLSVRAWVEKENYWSVYFRFNERFYSELPDRAGISFPFPQLDVHLDR